MRKLSFLLGLGALVATAFVITPAFATAPARANSYTCDGTLAPGTYQHVVVPQDGICLSDGPVTIHAGLFVLEGATLVLGSEDNPSHTATITGGVHGTNAGTVEIHFSTINGGIDLQGGAGPDGPFGPTFNTIEDSTVNGGYTESDYDGFWNGFFRNNVHGSVNFFNNVVLDPDGNEFQTNVIHGNLNCFGNDPPPQQGDSGGERNHVTGRETGQCVGL
jgi:hypothetical protein